MPLHTIVDLLKRRELLPVDVVRSYVNRIEQLNPVLNAFITLDIETALLLAQTADLSTPLAGAPIAIKDNIVTKNLRTTCGSKILHNFVPPYDATAVLRLKSAGATILGKTNMDEFAMGSSNEYSYFGPVKNPYDHERVPGGSSGGSAAAVASGMAPAALGSDTGGSVRQPASFCGIVGFKPSYGRISRYGLVAFASSLDQIGFLCKDVQDAILLYSICAGPDEKDATMIRRAPEPVNIDMEFPSDMSIAVLSDSFSPAVDECIRNRLSEILRKLPWEYKVIDVFELDYAIATYYIIAPAEVSANLARYDGVRYGFRAEGEDLRQMYINSRSEGFGPEVKRRIMIGTFVLSAGYQQKYFGKAQRARKLISNKLNDLFTKYKFIISPTTPTQAFKLGEKIDDPIQMYLSDRFTVSANLIGSPAISIPIHNKGELPYGMHIMSAPANDAELLSFAEQIEQVVASL